MKYVKKFLVYGGKVGNCPCYDHKKIMPIENIDLMW